MLFTMLLLPLTLVMSRKTPPTRPHPPHTSKLTPLPNMDFLLLPLLVVLWEGDEEKGEELPLDPPNLVERTLEGFPPLEMLSWDVEDGMGQVGWGAR